MSRSGYGCSGRFGISAHVIATWHADSSLLPLGVNLRMSQLFYYLNFGLRNEGVGVRGGMQASL
jgi:hypothetical protein